MPCGRWMAPHPDRLMRARGPRILLRSTGVGGIQESTNRKRRDRQLRLAVNDQIGGDPTDDWTQLESVRRKSEGVKHIRRSGTRSDHRNFIRHSRFDACPAAMNDCGAHHGNEIVDGPCGRADSAKIQLGSLLVAPDAAQPAATDQYCAFPRLLE